MTIDVHTYRDKTVAVMGLGKSGLATVRALMASGATVIAWDDNAERRDQASDLGARIEDLSNPNVYQAVEALVLSPGIPHTHPSPHPAASAAKACDVPIVGDVALLADSCPAARYVGITGTNGKSTTTALIGHILEQAGRTVQVGGNLGTPPMDFSALGTDGIYVLEMSSYQLELSPVHFDVAVLLNITPDHLARHGGMDGYVAAKSQIFDGQTADDTAVVSIDDERCIGIAEALTSGPRKVLPVSVNGSVAGGVYVDNHHLIDATDGGAEKILDLSIATTLPGRHNWENAAAAYATALALGIDRDTVLDGICSFPGLPHRQQMVGVIDGIAFVNDSKATNAEAAAKALTCYPTIYWIAGGVEKEGGYDDLLPCLGHVRHAFLIGEGAANIEAALDTKVPHTRSGDLTTAVKDAYALAKAEGAHRPVVLLSPACASFDQFENFEIRGDAFCRAVNDLDGKDRKLFVKPEQS